MNGTSRSQTAAIDLMPPRITSAVSTVMMPPEIHDEMPKVSCTSVEIELACTVLPMPKALTAVSAAKRSAERPAPHAALEHVHRSAGHRAVRRR